MDPSEGNICRIPRKSQSISLLLPIIRHLEQLRKLVKKKKLKCTFKVDIQRYFTLIIFREIAQRVHANHSIDNFRPPGKH